MCKKQCASYERVVGVGRRREVLWCDSLLVMTKLVLWACGLRKVLLCKSDVSWQRLKVQRSNSKTYMNHHKTMNLWST